MGGSCRNGDDGSNGGLTLSLAYVSFVVCRLSTIDRLLQILTKWRVQGEIASAAQLETVCSSEDCPETMRVALRAIKSSDLTFTVTTYVIFQDGQIAEQHHCWDQVGVFKRLFGGEIPPVVQRMLAIP